MDGGDERLSSPVLVYDRIEQNVRDTRLLTGLFVLFVLPAMAFLVEYGVVWLLMLSPAVLDKGLSEQQLIRACLFLGSVILLGMLVMAVLKYRSAAESALHAVGARPPSPEEAGFVRIVENLCIGAGLPVPCLHVVDSWLPNAFSVGFAPERASLVVTRGLLDLLDRPELEGVIAHELSHIGNRDSRLNTVLSAILRTMIIPFPIRVVLWLGILSSLPMFFSQFLYNIEAFNDFPPYVRLLIGMQTVLVVWALLWPWVGRFIQHLVSRRREFLADADAVLLTRYPEGLARALGKASSAIAAGGVSVKKCAGLANPAFSHLFLLTPITSWKLFDSHPPAGTRIGILAGMDTGIQQVVLNRARAAGTTYAESRDRLGKSNETALGDTNWLDNIPTMLSAALHGIRYGILSMAVFFALNGVLAIIVGVRFSVDAIRNSLLILSSIGYAVAGYSAARHFAPRRKIALLGTCFILYFIWMIVTVLFFMNLEKLGADLGGIIILGLSGGLILVFFGGAAGAMTQAALITRVFWRLLLSSRRSAQSSRASPWHTQQYRAVDEEIKPHRDLSQKSGSGLSAGHPVKCPSCGAIIADTDSMCAWCGYKPGLQRTQNSKKQNS
jgi:heat shock protein HtpX